MTVGRTDRQTAFQLYIVKKNRKEEDMKIFQCWLDDQLTSIKFISSLSVAAAAVSY